MKISYIITRSDTIGGAHVHVKDLAVSLLKAGHVVRVFVGGEGPFTNMLHHADVPYTSLQHMKRNINPWNDALAVLELKRELLNFSPDLVACHSSKAGWIGRLAAKLLAIPVVFTAHGWAFTKGVPALRRTAYMLAEKIVAPLSSHIITVSEYDRKLAIQANITKPENISMVWNGIENTPHQHKEKTTSRSVKLNIIARLDAQKNHRDLFRALEGLKSLSWTLDVIGDGPLMKELIDLAISLGIDDRINFLGLQTDAASLLKTADIFTLISNWEGLPISILEAMRFSIPVIATDVGGVSEAVIDNVTGFLIPPGNTILLEQRIKELVTDQHLRDKFGLAGRDLYEEHFSLTRMVNETMLIYNKAVQISSS